MICRYYSVAHRFDLLLNIPTMSDTNTLSQIFLFEIVVPHNEHNGNAQLSHSGESKEGLVSVSQPLLHDPYETSMIFVLQRPDCSLRLRSVYIRIVSCRILRSSCFGEIVEGLRQLSYLLLCRATLYHAPFRLKFL